MNSIEAIHEKVNQRAWNQTSPEARRLKLRQYRRGESLGRDIPADEKQRVDRIRVFKKLLMALFMLGFVLIAA